MKLRKFFYIFICLILACCADYAYAGAAKKSKAKTTQSATRKTSKSSTGKKSAKSSSKTKKSTGSASKNTKNSKNAKGSSKSTRAAKSTKNASRSKSKKTTKTAARRNVVKTVYKEEAKEVAQNDSLTLAVNSNLLRQIPAHLNPGGLRVNSVTPDKRYRVARVGLNENFTYMPISREFIDTLSRMVRKALPDSISDYRVDLNVGKKALSYYIHKVDKLPDQYRKNPNFVEEVHPIVTATKGMDNDIIALWHSHGRYFKEGSWTWQRPFLFETAEDIYTMGYILPYVVPMLENAGAYVMLPRERDPNKHEVIVDNDTNEGGQLYSQPFYKEQNGANKWTTGEEEGFIYDLPDFRDTENPFENGTYRQVATQKGGKPSMAAWYADIPEDGEYAVYVSYKSLPNSTTDAHYTVNYSGGTKEYKVNQTMGGGTWIYLGTFPFEAGYSDIEPVVTLSNLTDGAPGTLVTADAVKIGGGMGNIARSSKRSDVYYDPSTPEDEQTPDEDEEIADEEIPDGESDDIADTAESSPASQSVATQSAADKKGPAPRFVTSGAPRFVEGARYWLHWAGFPEYVYSPYHGTNDYKDDYTSRGHWVNYLAGGSRVLPKADGLKIPVDAAFALHSDAGKRDNDSFVGTLGIYFTQNGANYADGTPRINSRMLTDMVMQQICNDIRREWEPNWTRRSMWDKSYVEARVPEVPTTLIELMSHQNYADMTLGLDPNFRFTVGRAIYKGIARFMAERKGRKLVIQPLPVHNFQIKATKAKHYRLSWKATHDPLEPTATPSHYIIMERSGSDLGFHKIGETKTTHFDLRVTDNDIHSFYVIAANEGGASFPSETLALREATGDTKPVLIVNDFTRISAPGHHNSDGNAGFDSQSDFGVPYIRDISFSGHQTEFRRSTGNNFGASARNHVDNVIAGNTFDYPAVHGEALAAAGLGFVSCSAGAVESGEVKLADYQLVDLIVGKQKKTLVGNGKKGIMYAAFPPELQKALRSYVEKGGRLIVSGQYVASELFDVRSSMADRKFGAEVLGIEGVDADSKSTGNVRDVATGSRIRYSSTLNDKQYIVERPDIIIPVSGRDATPLLSFDSGRSAGHVVNHERGRVAVVTIPIEAMSEKSERNAFVKKVVSLLKN